MKKNHAIALWTAGVVLAGLTVQAGLVLNINSTDKTFAFTGSDSGTGFGNVVSWYGIVSDGYVGTVGSGSVYDLTPAISSNLEYRDSGWQNLDISVGSGRMGMNYTFNLALAYTTTETTTLTGTGVYLSYASFDAGAKDYFESFGGKTLALSNGSDFSSISVEAVPEPATAGLLGISALVLYGLRRAKNHYRS